MGRDRQAGGACSRISYVLVLLASLLAFDYEPTDRSERLPPNGVYSVVVDEVVGDPTPDAQGAITFPIFNQRPSIEVRHIGVAAIDDRDIAAQWSDHFDARGPPRQT